MARRTLSIAIALSSAAAIAGSSFTPATASALSAPERLRVSHVTATEIAFHWSQNTGGSAGTVRARVFQNGAQVATTPLVRHTASGLVPGATYSFHVVAFDAAGNTSPPSRTITVTTRGPGVVPPGPANLRATEVAAARAGLAFDQPDDAWDIGHYEVFDGTARIASVPASSFFAVPTVTLDVRGLAPESSHEYSVRAVRPSGPSPASNPLTVRTLARTDLRPPSAPTGLTARAATYPCFSPRLTWTQSVDDRDPRAAIDYEVLVGGTHDQWVRGAGAAVVAEVPVGVSTIGVRAVDSSGNASALATTTFTREPSCTDDG
ncbi:fibronectin type III domain-containing protein [Bailinhaonella thermotolerans]|uniref:Fibronectin type III domain-containing protein n=1 Tax=Bailinhaonella thermotolerans TaxID=1070861 RepID=A0A3A4AVV7_9ACTN|nr:fibronectin type III domain-containing protein [Bailinhaonella thermotolerans]RJL30013.1 fibronectin type III domain-containing protein [Bailinhaonella thermotolerans]